MLLIGFVGGVAMASIAAARRTQSSYPTFIANTNPSQLTMAVYSSVANGGPGPSLTAQIERLPGVKVVRTMNLNTEFDAVSRCGVPFSRQTL
jgi:hypothetical protein